MDLVYLADPVPQHNLDIQRHQPLLDLLSCRSFQDLHLFQGFPLFQSDQENLGGQGVQLLQLCLLGHEILEYRPFLSLPSHLVVLRGLVIPDFLVDQCFLAALSIQEGLMVLQLPVLRLLQDPHFFLFYHSYQGYQVFQMALLSLFRLDFPSLHLYPAVL